MFSLGGLYGALQMRFYVILRYVMLCTDQPLLSDTFRRRHLSFISHLCRADTSQGHSRALQVCIRGPPKDWRRRTVRPRQTWLRTVEDDLRRINFGVATARRRALDRSTWRQPRRPIFYGSTIQVSLRQLTEAATSTWHAPARERERERERESYRFTKRWRDALTLHSRFGWRKALSRLRNVMSPDQATGFESFVQRMSLCK